MCKRRLKAQNGIRRDTGRDVAAEHLSNGKNPSAHRAHHALDQCVRDPDHGGVGLAHLQRVAAFRLQVSGRLDAGRLARRRAAVAFRGDVAARRQRARLPRLRHRLRAFPAQAPAGLAPARCCATSGTRCAASSRTTICASTTPRSARRTWARSSLAVVLDALGARDLEARAVSDAGPADGRLRRRALRAFLRDGGARRSSCSCTSSWWRSCRGRSRSMFTGRTSNRDAWKVNRERMAWKCRSISANDRSQARVAHETTIRHANSLKDLPRGQVAQLERRLFLRRGLSLGALTLLSGCDVTNGSRCRRCCGRCRAGTIACRTGSSIPTGSRRSSRKAAITKPFPFNAFYGDGRGAARGRRELQARGLRARAREEAVDAARALRAARRSRRSRGTSASKAGARSASGAACASAISCSASAPTSRRNTWASSARTTTTPASTCRPRCIRRPCSRSGSPTRSCRAEYGFPMKLRMPTKLGFKNPKHITALFVTNEYPGRLLGGPGVQLVQRVLNAAIRDRSLSKFPRHTDRRLPVFLLV